MHPQPSAPVTLVITPLNSNLREGPNRTSPLQEYLSLITWANGITAVTLPPSVKLAIPRSLLEHVGLMTQLIPSTLGRLKTELTPLVD